jgi:CheY-like chemotaxis protein
MEGPHWTEEDESRLFDAVAHDLNNQLAAISGFAEQIAGALPASHESRADAEQILRAVQRASVLVALCHGVDHVAPRRTDLFEIAGLASRLIRKLHPFRDEVSVAGVERGAVWADPGALLEVLLQLDREGSVVGENGAPSLSSIAVGGMRGFQLEFPSGMSEGAEIPPRALALVAQMQGELEHEDDAFRLLLPAPPSHGAADAEPPRFEHVLLAEPDDLLRSFLVTALDARHVEEVADGAAAAELLRSDAECLDLVVLPIELEGLDVLAGYDRLREANEHARLVLIGRDGALAEELRRRVDADANALFVEKPFTVAHLVRTIDEMAREGLETE